MLRRSFLQRFGAKSTLMLLNSSTSAADRDAEIARENELRAKVTRGMNTPRFDHSVYASYETSPGNYSTSAGGSSSAPPPPPSQSAFFPNFSTFMSRMGNSGGSNNNNGSKPKPGLSDYFAFATGLILIAYSIKLLFKGAGPGSDGSIIPMWAITPMLKAKYILFTVITTDAERENLKAEFDHVQKTMPFLSFFDWLDQRYPNWGAGRRYPQEHVISVIAQAIGPNSGATAIARLVAEVMQKKSGGLLGLGSKAPTDRMQLVDEMVETIRPAIAAQGGHGGFGGGAAPFGAAPHHQQQQFYPNVNPQWGMQQQQQYYPPQQGSYGSSHSPSYGQGQQHHAQHNMYHQQPTELKGTQEINLSDITGGAPVPQHHYISDMKNGKSDNDHQSVNSSINDDVNATSDSSKQQVPVDDQQHKHQRDPLSRSS